MPIFEYKCNGCLSVFEQMFSSGDKICCLSCNSQDVERNYSGNFAPKKAFCPKEESCFDFSHS